MAEPFAVFSPPLPVGIRIAYWHKAKKIQNNLPFALCLRPSGYSKKWSKRKIIQFVLQNSRVA
jgi:hypothetical protein